MTNLEMINRRDFLKMLGLGAAAVVGGCASIPLERLVLDYVPDRKSKIAFTANGDKGIQNLWIVNPDGSELKRLDIKLPDYFVGEAKFSPNGKYLLVAKDNWNKEKEMHEKQDLTILDLEGKVWRTIEAKKDIDIGGFVWNPNGTHLFYSIFPNGNDGGGGIYEYNIHDDSTNRITFNSGYVYAHNPAVSPDNKKVAFVHHEWGTSYGIYVIGKNWWSSRTTLWRGSDSEHNEDLEPVWLTNKDLVWKNENLGELHYHNLDTDKHKCYSYPGIQHISLSPDKKTIAIFGGILRMIETANIISNDTITSHKKDSTSSFAWSPDSKYYVAGKRIYDLQDNQYLFLEENKGLWPHIMDWSPGSFKLGPLVKK